MRSRTVLRSTLSGVAALAVVGLALTGCARGSTAFADAGGRLRVVATTPVVADFARNVGGDDVVVVEIIHPNVDPHDFEPSPADLKALADADVVVQNGLGLESWLDAAIRNSGFDGLRVDTSEGVAVHERDGAKDPHIWHDPRNARIMSQNIAAALSDRDGRHTSAYQANLTAYETKLDALERRVQTEIDTIPSAQRRLVTNHDALGYYVTRYGLDFVGSVIPSFDSSAELSGKDISRTAAKIRATGTRAVFSEASLPPKTARTIADEAGVRVVAGEDSLYTDSLGPKGSPGETYLQMEQHNTDVIVGALR